ncbi:MAG: RtcB family protein [Bacteroidaceae bacterium]|nr:RtcB family protein [Bacteroidaceae bacterium]
MNLKIFATTVEQDAISQIYRLASQPHFAGAKIRIMPDTHAGAGCVIGFTANLGDKVVPNLVGVDIGCGMLVANIGNVDLDLAKLDKIIRENIPNGSEVNGRGMRVPFDKME